MGPPPPPARDHPAATSDAEALPPPVESRQETQARDSRPEEKVAERDETTGLGGWVTLPTPEEQAAEEAKVKEAEASKQGEGEGSSTKVWWFVRGSRERERARRKIPLNRLKCSLGACHAVHLLEGASCDWWSPHQAQAWI